MLIFLAKEILVLKLPSYYNNNNPRKCKKQHQKNFLKNKKNKIFNYQA